MIITFKQSNQTQSETPIQLIGRNGKEFQNMIELNNKRIKELKAGWEHAERIISTMKKHVHATLPNVNTQEVVWWILNFSNEHYLSYVKSSSTGWNQKIWNTIIKQNSEKYEWMLWDYLRNETFNTDFGQYHLELQGIEYSLEWSTPYQFNYLHKNAIQWMVRAHGTWDSFALEKDEVSLHDFAQGCKPIYFSMDVSNLTKDHSDAYASHMESEYIPNHHRPCIHWLHSILWG